MASEVPDETSSVATSHGWARVGTCQPAPAVLGHGIRPDLKSFLGGGWWGRGRRRTDSATDLHIENHLTVANCLHISAPGPRWGTAPCGPCAHPDFRVWLYATGQDNDLPSTARQTDHLWRLPSSRGKAV